MTKFFETESYQEEAKKQTIGGQHHIFCVGFCVYLFEWWFGNSCFERFFSSIHSHHGKDKVAQVSMDTYSTLTSIELELGTNIVCVAYGREYLFRGETGIPCPDSFPNSAVTRLVKYTAWRVEPMHEPKFVV